MSETNLVFETIDPISEKYNHLTQDDSLHFEALAIEDLLSDLDEQSKLYIRIAIKNCYNIPEDDNNEV